VKREPEKPMMKKLFQSISRFFEWIAEGQKKQPVCKT
jgi:hypothetical protein